MNNLPKNGLKLICDLIEINESFEVLRNIDNHCKAQVKKENGDIIDVQFNNDLDVLAVENMIESITY